jgi:hypothetical protein
MKKKFIPFIVLLVVGKETGTFSECLEILIFQTEVLCP